MIPRLEVLVLIPEVRDGRPSQELGSPGENTKPDDEFDGWD